MRVFANVADSGSITKTARALNTTQSSVSRQIASLEAELGGALFHRNGRGVILTDFGQRIASRVHEILAQIEQISIEASSEAGIPTGEVTIGMLSTVGPTIAARLHHAIQRQFPKVRLQIVDGFSGQLNAAVADGQLDMALLFRYAVEQIAGDQPIAVLHSYLVGPRGDALTSGPTVAFSRLSRIPLVVPRLPNGLRLALDHFAAGASVDLMIAIEASSVPIQLAIVAEPMNRTYGVASYYAVAEGLRRDQLQAARIVSPGIERTLTLVRSQRRPSTLATREVAVMLVAIAGELLANDPQI